LLDGMTTAGREVTPVNPLGFTRAEVARARDGALHFVMAAPFSTGAIAAPLDDVHIQENKDGTIRLENAALSALLSRGGRVLSLVDRATGREDISDAAKSC